MVNFPFLFKTQRAYVRIRFTIVLILFQSINWFTVFPSLELSSTMKMEAETSSETLTSTYDSKSHHKPEVYNLEVISVSLNDL